MKKNLGTFVIFIFVMVGMFMLVGSPFMIDRFGRMSDFEFEDCSLYNEDFRWVCEIGNHSALASDIVGFLFIVVISFVVSLGIKYLYRYCVNHASEAKK